MVVVNLLVILSVGLLELVVLLVELVNIVEKLHVLLFSLYKCCDDLLDAADARGFHDCFESLLDDFGIPHILIQEALFF